jgi:hypothetical protein
MSPDTRPDVWWNRLKSLADPVLDVLADGLRSDSRSFRDEFGGRREIDAYLVARHVGFAVADGASSERLQAPDLALWDALCRGAVPPPAPGRGPLIPTSTSAAIELWTESELCALHAAWWLGRSHASWRERVIEAARWHVENTQPDNATGHPWSIHVFIDLTLIDESAEAELLAQTMLHNCIVERGAPDRRSALILHDAARALEMMRY